MKEIEASEPFFKNKLKNKGKKVIFVTTKVLLFGKPAMKAKKKLVTMMLRHTLRCVYYNYAVPFVSTQNLD